MFVRYFASYTQGTIGLPEKGSATRDAFSLTNIESLRQLSDTPLISLSPAASCASGMVEVLQVNRITETTRALLLQRLSFKITLNGARLYARL